MRRWLWILLLCGMAACERQTDWELIPPDQQWIVVNGSITNEFKRHEVRLTLTSDSLNERPEVVSDAYVAIGDGDSIWVLTESMSEPGTYVMDHPAAGSVGKTYTLTVRTKDKELTASDYMAPVSPLSVLSYAETGGSEGLYHVSWIAPGYHPAATALYRISIDWSFLPGYAGTDPALCHAVLYYATLSTIDVSDIFSPRMEQIDFPEGTVITEYKYSMSPAYENFIRCMLLETSWRGGFFDATSSNLPTNIEGGVGYFSASAVQSAVVVVNP